MLSPRAKPKPSRDVSNPKLTREKQDYTGVSTFFFCVALLGGVLFLVPLLVTLFSFAVSTDGAQAHIWATTGIRYLLGTMGLCLCVGVGAGLIGTLAAALVALTEFPGRRILTGLLILPFAIPAYLMAYIYGDFFSPFGLWNQWGAGAGLALPHISVRNFFGAVVVLTLSVYPYVYVAMRAEFAARAGGLSETAMTLGMGPLTVFRSVLWPAARPAFFGSLALALMETAADYGVSEHFGVQTLSTGIFRTWYGLGNLTAASQLAGGLFLVALFLLLLERAGRRGSYANPAQGARRGVRWKLNPFVAIAASIFSITILIAGFLLPVGLLVEGMLDANRLHDSERFWKALSGTAVLAGAVSLMIMIFALGLAYWERLPGSGWQRHVRSLFIRVMTLGYALPGAVIAVGILLAFSLLMAPLGITITQGGLLILAYAYVLRFLTVGYQSANAGLGQVHQRIDEVARILGSSALRILSKLHMPLISRSLLAGLFIVFIDVSRELPATLLLRPFNFETLATEVFRLASDERLDAASPYALVLIAIGLIPVVILGIVQLRKQGNPGT